MCRGMRSIQLWIRFCFNCLVQHSVHRFSALIRVVGDLFRVVFLFIHGQHGSIIFKSGEFSGHSRRKMSAFINILCWCFEAWLGALFFCTIVSGRFILHSCAKGMSLGMRICFWYLFNIANQRVQKNWKSQRNSKLKISTLLCREAATPRNGPVWYGMGVFSVLPVGMGIQWETYRYRFIRMGDIPIPFYSNGIRYRYHLIRMRNFGIFLWNFNREI